MQGISVTENKTLMARARESLRGKWGLAIGVHLLYFVILCLASAPPVLEWILPLLITAPLVVGLTTFSTRMARHETTEVGNLFAGFNRYGASLGLYLLTILFVILWGLLLIIPGIIAAFSYSMAFFILADDPGIGPLEALRKSKQMMQGHKWKYCCLGFRFIGWFLLCIPTLGIGLLWVFPYFSTSAAHFYLDLKRAYEEPEGEGQAISV